jgi:predicted cobalt transporter CbtA
LHTFRPDDFERQLGIFSIHNADGLELLMTIQTSLIIILIGAFFMMAGVLFFKEPSNNYRSSFTECVAWGVGFFLSMSVQVVLIATMS